MKPYWMCQMTIYVYVYLVQQPYSDSYKFKYIAFDHTSSF